MMLKPIQNGLQEETVYWEQVELPARLIFVKEDCMMSSRPAADSSGRLLSFHRLSPAIKMLRPMSSSGRRELMFV